MFDNYHEYQEVVAFIKEKKEHFKGTKLRKGDKYFTKNPFQDIFFLPYVKIELDCQNQLEFPSEYIGKLRITETEFYRHFGIDVSFSSIREKTLLSIDHRLRDYLDYLSTLEPIELSGLNCSSYIPSMDDFESFEYIVIRDRKGRERSFGACPQCTLHVAKEINTKRNKHGDIFIEVNYRGNSILDETFPDEVINADDYCCAEWFEDFPDNELEEVNSNEKTNN